jgi:hypothetical protein
MFSGFYINFQQDKGLLSPVFLSFSGLGYKIYVIPEKSTLYNSLFLKGRTEK